MIIQKNKRYKCTITVPLKLMGVLNIKACLSLYTAARPRGHSRQGATSCLLKWGKLSSKSGASCLLQWGELSSKSGASCLGASFIWGELSWGELSLGRVVLIPFPLHCRDNKKIIAPYISPAIPNSSCRWGRPGYKLVHNTSGITCLECLRRRMTVYKERKYCTADPKLKLPNPTAK